MLKSEMQHQFWVTKKAVQRKLGAREDEHIISSDAELDSKIEVFKSISYFSSELSKILAQYRECISILSEEECLFGRFLKEGGEKSKMTGLSITNTGKAVSFSGQQRICIRVPLERLHHEVDVFLSRAVRDTDETIKSMEKYRTEYRAALSWMKSASTVLDPDTGKGIDKFRTSQSHVRIAKHSFDGLSSASIQKIDLLAAARCNMYSHALVAYITELQRFSEKNKKSYLMLSKTLQQKLQYNFSVLKELTQHEINPNKDLKDYLAETPQLDETRTKPVIEDKIDILIDFDEQLDTLLGPIDSNRHADIDTTNWLEICSSNAYVTQSTNDFERNLKGTDNNAWLNLFADLDPLINPDFESQMVGGCINSQQT